MRALLAEQPRVLRDDAALADACRCLDELFPRSRYPDLPEPTPDETRRAIAAARLARARIIAVLPVAPRSTSG